MKFEKISIATARINGLNKCQYYLKEKCFWGWDIMFSDISCIGIYNLPFIYLSKNSEEEAVEEYHKLKAHFSDAGIYDGNKVALMVREDGYVRAIGTIGEDCWIDVEDKFVKKAFNELNVVITSLEVCI